MKVFRFSAVLLMASALCSAGFSQSPDADRPSREQVLKMFDVMHVQKQMQSMMKLMNAQVKEQLHTALQKQATAPTPDEEAKLEADASGAMNVYPEAEMLDDMIPIYQRHMTKADVDGIIAFYGSPSGQHLLEQSPVMIQESMQTIMPKVNERTQAYIAKVMEKSDPEYGKPPAKKAAAPHTAAPHGTAPPSAAGSHPQGT